MNCFVERIILDYGWSDQFFPLSHTSYNLYTYSAMCISEGINRIIDLSTVDGIDKSFVINYESC